MSALGDRIRSCSTDLAYAETDADRDYIASLLDNIAREVDAEEREHAEQIRVANARAAELFHYQEGTS